MKKIMFAVLSVIAMGFVSCGNKAGQNVDGVDSIDSVSVDSIEVVDSLGTDSTVCLD